MIPSGSDLLVEIVVDGVSLSMTSIARAAAAAGTSHHELPLSLRLLAANVADGIVDHGDPVAGLSVIFARSGTVPFRPRRVVHQDYTGTAALTDLAALRDAIVARGGDPRAVNPTVRTDFVVDHSLRVDVAGVRGADQHNLALELSRNAERYAFIQWASRAFDNLRVVPPGVGIVHQVNLELLADVVSCDGQRLRLDSNIGTDSHTTMVNALGVFGWGVGGIEAEAGMLGQPLPVTLPTTVGVELRGELPRGTAAMDVALLLAEELRANAPVGAFLDFFGPGVRGLALPDRATISNMAPEYGLTMALFPIDEATIAFLRGTGRPEAQLRHVEVMARHEGLWGADRYPGEHDVRLSFDLSAVRRTVSGPSLPQQVRRVAEVPASWQAGDVQVTPPSSLSDGAVVIASITSCTNTSNPSALVAAGLLARNARDAGLALAPWVKSSFTPGSPVVPAYLDRLGLLAPLEDLGFAVAGFGCGTCAGGSGDLLPAATASDGLKLAAVLSGNRNFPGRIHPACELNYLASPELVVAYALAGSVAVDLERLTFELPDGRSVPLSRLLPDPAEVARLAAQALQPTELKLAYTQVLPGPTLWRQPQDSGAPPDCYPWEEDSTWLRCPSIGSAPPAGGDLLVDAPVLLALGDDVTTDHISPAGAIASGSPAARWLRDAGQTPEEFGTYGARRGNFEVMVRGTFANPHLANALCPNASGGMTVHGNSSEVVDVFEAASRYRAAGQATVILAGERYGCGSSRDWAAKGTALLGVRAVLARSFERIHRSNLVWCGVLPIEVPDLPRVSPATRVSIGELPELPGQPIAISVTDETGSRHVIGRPRLDNDHELAAYRAGGLLPLTLGKLLGTPRGPGPDDSAINGRASDCLR